MSNWGSWENVDVDLGGPGPGLCILDQPQAVLMLLAWPYTLSDKALEMVPDSFGNECLFCSKVTHPISERPREEAKGKCFQSSDLVSGI